MPQLHAADLPVPHTGQHLQTDPAPAAKKLSANIVANGNQKNNRSAGNAEENLEIVRENQSDRIRCLE